MTNDNVTTSAVSPPEEHAGAGLSHRQILTVLTGLMLGMFLAALDQTIVSTAIRTIADDLQGYDMQAWVTTAYLVTSTIVTPLYGKLSDLYGRKPFFLLAISIFVIGSLACSMATSMYELAAFRAFQGLGAGGLFTLALTTIGDIVPPRERAKYQGYFLAVFGTSSVLGPVLGGLFAGQSSILWVSGWRWVFLVNVPIGILALAVVYRVLNYDQNKGVGGRTDYWGATALAVTVAPLLIVAEQGREWGWLSGWSWLCYIVGAVGLAVFVFIEHLMGDDALIRCASSRIASSRRASSSRWSSRGDVRRHLDAAAVLPGAARVEPDGRGPADAADGARADDRVGAVGSADLADRTVQDLHHPGFGPDHGDDVHAAHGRTVDAGVAGHDLRVLPRLRAR